MAIYPSPHVISDEPFSLSISGGMRIDVSEEQSKKADEPMTESLLPLSKVTLQRRLHPKKQPFEICSTDEGIDTESRDEQSSNAHSPRTESLLPLSNRTIERLVHRRKQSLEMVSIDERIEIEVNDEQQRNADAPRIEM
jgi:hypothetical protein